MYSFTEENYLKAIYKLSERAPDSITTNAIAEVLETKAASVTDMIKKLSDKKLLKYEKYRGVALTEKGRLIAVETVRKHRLWETFLHEKLEFGWDEVHDIAEQLEHINSEALTNKLDDFLGNPSHDPHGDPIPTRSGEIKKSDLILLCDAKLKQKVLMSGVVDHSAPFLQHLNKIALALGCQIEVLDKNEYDGSIEIKLGSSSHLHLSKEVAKNILVKIR
ncbi:iron-dependent repressor [Bacteroidetes bacterium UKL13-3]|jgi:DtxR family Mn-dependent transcriptional regulator|nr:iron-dependent repressor [Bacteroidetes bacterium UKL13-3]HCP93258.1 iron-dependent repressor [Bacteroidota bacterium]